MKINKLIGLSNTITLLLDGISLRELNSRRIGASTGLALKYISEALLNPDEEIKIYDHAPTHKAKYILLDTIKDIINELELKNFTFRIASQPTIKFEIYEEIDDSTFLQKLLEKIRKR